MTPLYLSATLRRLEADYAQHEPPLIELAGKSIAQWLLARYRGSRFGVLVGPGNNGADALACARRLREAGQALHCLVPLARKALSSPDAALLALSGLQVVDSAGLSECDVIVDGLFGLGLNRRLDTSITGLLEAIDGFGKPIVAIDAPSGLDSDRGVPSPVALHATHTLSMLGAKPGYYTAAGRDYCGEVHLIELLPPTAARPAADAQLIDTQPNAPQLHRQHVSHKGTYGTLAIFGGSAGMTGAALLAGRMAAKSGAGKVYLGLLDPVLGVDVLQPELMLQAATDLVKRSDLDLAAIGPGLGRSQAAQALLQQLLASDLPLLLDADALNLLSSAAELQQQLRTRTAPSIITPHPAEAARLLGLPTNKVQEDRLAAARELQARLNTAVLLKGSGTICADCAGISINGSGNGALATAGQGDILSGLIASLWLQGLSPIDAARLSAFVHGHAADDWRMQHRNGLGLCASELIEPIRTLLNR
ncbi:NAD(P)H-hydrate dehydratase [Jeongeupia naejangsanensis]|uniref:Bifunctional NAD(P)H-hydrate repair enzyme n=1 Tax=Jeongeupia naejangsanensis TaxID=613195 RepID=A0ABS2BQ51_9NEIS|nr:NAD(P)H-hydrate dehydratase [Jeongeupia naejangsanensis]MBM3117535.1 NAD(P)H-hydrate dehydratase [Jeongeupia naejangsanensis]